MNVKEFRAQHPGAYDDLTDQQIADGLYAKHYSDMDRNEFNAKFLAGASQPSAPGGRPLTGGAASVPALPTTPAQVFMAVPKAAAKFAYGAGKAMVEDAANYPQARIVDPAVQAARSIGGIMESDPAKRAANARPTPEEAERNQRARAFELSLAAGGPAEGIAKATVGRIPGVIGRLLQHGATGAIVGGTDAGVRNNSLEAVPAGAAGGAVLGSTLGEFIHRAGKGGAKAEPPVAPPAVEGVSEHFRMGEAPPNKTPATVRALKNVTMGYHHPFPLLAGRKLSTGESLSDAFVKGLQGVQDAEERGVLGASEFWNKNLTGTPQVKADKMNLVRQHVTAAAILDDFQNGKALPPGLTPEMLEKAYTETAIAVSQDPEVANAAGAALRARYDQFHGDLTNRGYGVGYRQSYSPLKNVEHIESFTPPSDTPGKIGRLPSFMKARGEEGVNRSYDVPKLMAEYETQYHKKIAEDDLISKIAKDPATNLAATKEGRAQLRKDGIPDGYVAYEAQKGMPGHGKTGAKGKPVMMVIHRDVAESLSKFYPKPLGETAQAFNKIGGFMARTATSLNPQNTGMNVPSDLIMTLAGPAGEKGTITKGIAARRLGEYPGALASMLKSSFGGTSEKANFGRKAGAISGTFQHEIGATQTPRDLKDFYYPEPLKDRAAPGRLLKNALSAPAELLQRTRNATEAAPRLATAVEAKKRGLPEEEVSRLAHESSLPYGSGTSAFSKSAPAKGLARFATYPGLADVRIIQGAIKEGSRGRYAALLTVPPAAAAMWNTQDEEFSNAEKRLKPWVKSSLHVLVKKPDGFDVYVIRADPFSEATNRWGVGQLSGRVVKAAKGVEPISFKDSPKEVLDSYGSLYPIGPLIESARGETKYHRPLDTPLKRASNLMPVVRLGLEAFETEKKKPGEGGKMLLERTFGAGARRYDMKSVAGK